MISGIIVQNQGKATPPPPDLTRFALDALRQYRLDNASTGISVEYLSRRDKAIAFHDAPTNIPDPEVVPKPRCSQYD
jgi:hypothetical protein